MNKHRIRGLIFSQLTLLATALVILEFSRLLAGLPQSQSLEGLQPLKPALVLSFALSLYYYLLVVRRTRPMMALAVTLPSLSIALIVPASLPANVSDQVSPDVFLPSFAFGITLIWQLWGSETKSIFPNVFMGIAAGITIALLPESLPFIATLFLMLSLWEAVTQFKENKKVTSEWKSCLLRIGIRMGTASLTAFVALLALDVELPTESTYPADLWTLAGWPVITFACFWQFYSRFEHAFIPSSTSIGQFFNRIDWALMIAAASPALALLAFKDLPTLPLLGACALSLYVFLIVSHKGDTFQGLGKTKALRLTCVAFLTLMVSMLQAIFNHPLFEQLNAQ